MPAKDIPMPPRIARLPMDKRGYPILKFVEPAKPGAEPDFRIMSADHWHRCVRQKVCWVCGQPLGRHLAFVVGPMCCVNLISAEPPSHFECAAYSAQACPFLSMPKAKRRTAGVEEAKEFGGIMIERNPGVVAIWVTRSYEVMRHNGYFVQMGEPTRLEFWTLGRLATRQEIDEAIEAGLPALMEAAVAQGDEAVAEAHKAHAVLTARLDAMLPREVVA